MMASKRSALSLLALVVLVVVSSTLEAADAFQPFQITQRQPQQQQQKKLSITQSLQAKKNKAGKGFGSDSAPSKTKTTNSSTSSSSGKAFTPIATTPESKRSTSTTTASGGGTFEQSDVITADRPGTTRETEMNQGQKALQQMRREQAERKDAELRRVKEVRDTDRLLQSSPQAAVIPEKVAMRMGQRMLPFVGIPLFGSMGAFVAFWYFATYKNVEFEPGMVAASTILILVSGLVGITYSIISASWDEDREGSFMGTEEFQKNMGSIREGLSRSRENLLLREKMAGLPEAEIDAAIDALEKRDSSKGQSLKDKMESDLK